MAKLIQYLIIRQISRNDGKSIDNKPDAPHLIDF